MIDFVASLSWLGWGIISVSVLALFYLPKLYRGGGRSNLPEAPPPIGQPPDYRGPPSV